jgi:tRNA U34 5-carboxymethylaminomethyl modifying enzyme MnmG/GidA
LDQAKRLIPKKRSSSQ